MAFDKAGLQRVGTGVKSTAPSLWTYRTNDTLNVVDTAGYFDNGLTAYTGMREHMSVGDFVLVHATASGTATGGIVMVNSNTTGIIDGGDALAISAADTR